MNLPTHAEACLDRDALAAFVDEALSEDKMASAASHIAACSSCQEALEQSLEGRDGLLSSLKDLQGSGTIPADSPFGKTPPVPAASVAVKRQLREYQLLEKLGEGGMGVVYKAMHNSLGRVVALKLLSPLRTGDAASIARFQREMRAVGKLEHPHIVRATDAGEVEGTPFLAMEFVEGIDLARLVRKLGPLPIADACELVRQAALGLQHAHEHGLIHRDVKPSNLILTKQGQVKLLDLGLALLDGATTSGDDATGSHVVLGSFDYMAPEQADDPRRVDFRADLYSLGCTLFHLLTGQPPFPTPEFETPFQKMKAHATTSPPPLRRLRPDAVALTKTLDRLMAKEPGHRFKSAAYVAAALKPYAAGADLARLLKAQPAAMPGRVKAPPKRPWGWLAVAALVPLLLLAGAVVYYVQTDKGLVEIVSNDDDVKVSLEQNGKLITVLDKKANRQVVLQAGEYQLKIVEGGKEAELVNNGFTLKRGGVEVVTVRRVGKVPPGGHPPLAEAWLNLVAEKGWEGKAELVFEALKERNPEIDVRQWVARGEGNEVHLVDLCSDHLTDVTPLAALKSLPSLALWGSGEGKGRLSDLSPLAGLKLQKFDCRHNPVEDLSPLRGMPLDLLSVAFTRVKDLGQLKGLPLEVFNCTKTPVADLTPLIGLPLKNLICEQTAVKDLSPLRSVKTLVDLNCSGSPVASLEPLAGHQMARLNCAFTSVSDLAPLKGQPLTYLLCSGSKVGSLEPLRGAKGLTHLSCYLTTVADLEPVRGMPLSRLDIGDTRITDLSPIKGMPLRMLFFGNTKVPNLDALRGLSLTHLACPEPLLNDTDTLRALTELKYINTKPAAEVIAAAEAKKP